MGMCINEAVSSGVDKVSKCIVGRYEDTEASSLAGKRAHPGTKNSPLPALISSTPSSERFQPCCLIFSSTSSSATFSSTNAMRPVSSTPISVLCRYSISVRFFEWIAVPWKIRRGSVGACCVSELVSAGRPDYLSFDIVPCLDCLELRVEEYGEGVRAKTRRWTFLSQTSATSRRAFSVAVLVKMLVHEQYVHAWRSWRDTKPKL